MDQLDFSISTKLMLFVFSGMFLGVFFRLWSTYGVDVVLAYAAGVAMQCF